MKQKISIVLRSIVFPLYVKWRNSMLTKMKLHYLILIISLTLPSLSIILFENIKS